MNARRDFLKKAISLAAVPALLTISGKLFAQEKKKKKTDSPAGAAAPAAGTVVSPNDPTAKSLGYVEKSKTPGKHCGNCILFQACGKPQGACQVLPGKGDVLTGAYCNSWNQSPTCKG